MRQKQRNIDNKTNGNTMTKWWKRGGGGEGGQKSVYSLQIHNVYILIAFWPFYWFSLVMQFKSNRQGQQQQQQVENRKLKTR